MAKKQYTLFLDESETYIRNKSTGKNDNPHFCIAGVIIARDDYAKVENDVKQLKRTIWSEFSSPEDIILHQMLITDAEKGRLNRSKFPEYVKFNKKSERKILYNELKKIFDNNKITIIGSSINKETIQKYYNLPGKSKENMSLIAMQLLLENYCHFLCMNNGIGNIIYEYRELIDNERLRDRYYHMKLMGSMYMNRATAEKRLLGLDFVNKADNNIGLQIADFVPLSFARDHLGVDQPKPNIFSTLKYHRYNGGQALPERFGIKYMP